MAQCTTKRGRPRCFDKDAALAAAVEVFLKNGYEGTSLDDLTSALGINRPSLYSAFGNKEQLFLQVLQGYHRVYQTFLEDLLARNLGPRETMAEWFRWFLDNYENQSARLGCLIVNSTTLCCKEYPEISAELKRLHDLNQALLSDYFKREIDAGNLSVDADPLHLSQFYNAILQGMAVLRRSQGDEQALSNIVESALKLLPASQ